MSNSAARVAGQWLDKNGHSSYEYLKTVEYHCGYCGPHVASERGWEARTPNEAVTALIRICPNCGRPTFFEAGKQYPGPQLGDPIKHLPPDIEALYNEARTSTANAPTAAVLALRKLLMNVAVNKGASAGQSFQQYVDYLASKGYVSPDGKLWVDHIRAKGNDANHEIALMKTSDAEDLIAFAEMLLKTIYEFPSRVPKK